MGHTATVRIIDFLEMSNRYEAQTLLKNIVLTVSSLPSISMVTLFCQTFSNRDERWTKFKSSVNMPILARFVSTASNPCIRPNTSVKKLQKWGNIRLASRRTALKSLGNAHHYGRWHHRSKWPANPDAATKRLARALHSESDRSARQTPRPRASWRARFVLGCS